jgi:hypothetical protein
MTEYTVKINREQGIVEVSGDKEFVNEKLRELAPFYERAAVPGEAAKGGNGPASTRRQQPGRSTKTNEKGAAKTARRSSGPNRIKGLDLAPKGKKSFEAFVAEKQPKTQNDRTSSARTTSPRSPKSRL